MAGQWIKFDVATSDKPEVWAIATELELDPDAVVGKLLRVWAWFDDQTRDGNAPSVTTALLDRRVGVTGFCQAIVNVGWMVVEGDTVRLPNFERHNGETAKKRALGNKRVSKHRANGNAGSVTPSVTPSVTKALPEKRREEKSKEEDLLRKSCPVAPDAAAVLDHLNTVTSSQYRQSKSSLENINARLREGHTVDDLRAVVDFKAREWLGTDMAQYLRPKTLFAPEKFPGYLTAARSPPPQYSETTRRNIEALREWANGNQ